MGLGTLAVAGLAVFAYLVAGRYGTPFVVASKVGIGGLVFLLGRLAVAAVHETAHGLVMASFGRRVREAGVKRVLIFPYVYVDTSEMWFAPRRRRIAVSAAGPASDLCLGGAFALCCLAAAPGPLRDVLFQLAFGAYVGAFFNLNPMVERDGYHMLVDVLREPGLRARAREQLRRRIAGRGRASDSAVLTRYSLLGLGWSAAGRGDRDRDVVPLRAGAHARGAGAGRGDDHGAAVGGGARARGRGGRRPAPRARPRTAEVSVAGQDELAQKLLERLASDPAIARRVPARPRRRGPPRRAHGPGRRAGLGRRRPARRRSSCASPAPASPAS